MAERNNISEFNAILESDTETLDLVHLSKIAMNLSEKEKSDLEWDALQEYLDGIDPNELSLEDLNAVIDLSELWTHFICTLFYQASPDLFSESQLKRIVKLPDCEEDNGRSDSCFGVHFFVTLQEHVSDAILETLLERDHYDEGFFPWLVARNRHASPQLLGRVAEMFTNEFSWRVGGNYTEEDFLIEDDEVLKSFILFQIANNSNTPGEVRVKFASKIDFLTSTESSHGRDLRPEDLREELEKV